MDAIELDHVALGLPRAQDAVELFEERLGGAPAGGFRGVPFGFQQWQFAGGGRIEVIYPTGPEGGFVHRFLAAGGPRVHHVTFKVPSLDAVVTRAESLGYGIVGSDRSDPYWQEAFLHPKQALGIVVQMVEQRPRPEGEDWPTPAPRQNAARVAALRLSARSESAARKQWSDLLGASAVSGDDELEFRWPDSPIALRVDLVPQGDEGPLWIELAAERDLALPLSLYPGLGTRFVQIAEPARAVPSRPPQAP
jgi:methylmalonyl-CoA/ethylmalonyl-CoA epimerase